MTRTLDPRVVLHAACRAAYPQASDVQIAEALDRLEPVAAVAAAVPGVTTADKVAPPKPKRAPVDESGAVPATITAASERSFDDGDVLFLTVAVDGGDVVACRIPAAWKTTVSAIFTAAGADDVAGLAGSRVRVVVGSYTGRDGTARPKVARWLAAEAAPATPKDTRPEWEKNPPSDEPIAPPKRSRNAPVIHGGTPDDCVPF